MSDFNQALTAMFGVKKPNVEKVPSLQSEPKKYITRNSIERTLGEPTVVAAAQSVFNPAQPVAPSPQVKDGTAQKLAMPGGWGGGN